jgi:hypothetical protein
MKAAKYEIKYGVIYKDGHAMFNNDVINELNESARQRVLKSELKWISVKDELPEEGTNVIVSDGKTVTDDCTFMPWGGHTEFTWQVHAYGYDNDSHTVENVSHWMPLPDAPNSTKPK